MSTSYVIVDQKGAEWGRSSSQQAAEKKARTLTESPNNDGEYHVEVEARQGWEGRRQPWDLR